MAVPHKTQALTELIPDAYAAGDSGSLLYRMLDAVGAELTRADDGIKTLVKSHWVDYASGEALDGLGSIFAVERRRLRRGSFEDDRAFRRRLRSIVPLFTGGGTRKAVLGNVRAALGLPFDLNELGLPASADRLRLGIEQLITLEEFAPEVDRLWAQAIPAPDGRRSAVALDVVPASVRAEKPVIEWRFRLGAGRELRLDVNRGKTGFVADDSLHVPQGASLRLSDDGQRLVAHLRTPASHLPGGWAVENVSEQFTNLDRSVPARLPTVPDKESQWKFQAAGTFDHARFDEDTFDLPKFDVEMSWIRYQPLTFEIRVPYHLESAVQQLADREGHKSAVLVYEGLPPERLQEVVDQTAAAGVRGHVSFSLYFFEDQAQREDFGAAVDHRLTEDAASAEAMTIGSVNNVSDRHDQSDSFAVGGVFDISRFDTGHAFVGDPDVEGGT